MNDQQATIAEQPSWLSGSGGRLAASGITLDSSASAAVRHPSISLAAPALSSHTFPRQVGHPLECVCSVLRISEEALEEKEDSVGVAIALGDSAQSSTSCSSFKISGSKTILATSKLRQQAEAGF